MEIDFLSQKHFQYEHFVVLLIVILILVLSEKKPCT